MSKLLRTNLWTVPSVLGNNNLDRIFDDVWVRAQTSFGKHAIPYNVINEKKGEEIVKTILEFAVAGYTKDHIDLKIKDDQLTVKASQPVYPEHLEFIKKGITSKEFELTLNINTSIVDVENISSKFQDGILVVNLPYVKEYTKLKEGRKIEIQ